MPSTSSRSLRRSVSFGGVTMLASPRKSPMKLRSSDHANRESKKSRSGSHKTHRSRSHSHRHSHKKCSHDHRHNRYPASPYYPMMYAPPGYYDPSFHLNPSFPYPGAEPDYSDVVSAQPKDIENIPPSPPPSTDIVPNPERRDAGERDTVLGGPAIPPTSAPQPDDVLQAAHEILIDRATMKQAQGRLDNIDQNGVLAHMHRVIRDALGEAASMWASSLQRLDVARLHRCYNAALKSNDRQEDTDMVLFRRAVEESMEINVLKDMLKVSKQDEWDDELMDAVSFNIQTRIADVAYSSKHRTPW